MRDTTETHGELQTQRHGGTVSRKVGAICEVCGWAWQPVVGMCHPAGLAASGLNSDPGRSDSEKRHYLVGIFQLKTGRQA